MWLSWRVLNTEIQDRRHDGFGDEVVRTVSENATVLRFDQGRFEID